MLIVFFDARTATAHFPGIGRYVSGLAHGLARLAGESGVNLLRGADMPGADLPNLPSIACAASPFSIRQQWMVPALLRRDRADVYHSPFYLMPYWPGVPTVLTCHDLIPLVFPGYFSAAQRLIYRLTNRLALSAARVVLSDSHSTKADLIRRFDVEPDRILVAAPAAGERFCPQPPEVIASTQARYALPERYALYLGINKPHKNLVRLVKAWQKLINEVKPRGLKLVIAGRWDERYPEAKRIVEATALQGEVVFAGPIHDAGLPAIYSGATLFVYPSLYEGFGLPVLEAMACGAPVACSSTSSLPEVAGDAALYFDPDDVDSIASTVRRAIADPDLRADLQRRGRARASQFTWERTARQTMAAYRLAAGK